MKYYMIQTVKTDDRGFLVVTFLREIFFLRQAAFKKADSIGEEAVVLELEVSETWNHCQRKEDQY